MLGPRSPWTWALVAALVLPGQSCLLDSGPFAGATSGDAGGGGAGGEAGSGGETAATTAPGPVCGNGKKEDGEACDDGNAIEGDGCFACEPDCGCPGCVAGELCRGCGKIDKSVILKDPLTRHCYLFVPAPRAHENARTACQEEWDADLVAPSTQAEMAGLLDPELVAAFKPDAKVALVWTGGRHNKGLWEWQNGEPWEPPPTGPEWEGGGPDSTAGTDCVAIDSEGKIVDRGCSDGLPFMCERTPL